MKSDLGAGRAGRSRGCLQDIHWSMGSIGYFPTYTLGNLYAAQLWEAARETMPNLDGRIERGEFGKLLGWLRTEIHAHGRRFLADELCRRVTGRALDHQPLVGYLKTKLAAIHG